MFVLVKGQAKDVISSGSHEFTPSREAAAAAAFSEKATQVARKYGTVVDFPHDF